MIEQVSERSTGATQPAQVTNPNGTLNQETFLQVLVAQLKAQNPLAPASSSEYLGELISLTELEQITDLANAGQLSGATGLLGHTVTYNDGKESVRGTVEKVEMGSSGVTLTVSGRSGVPENELTEIS